MNSDDVVTALAALAQPSRLAIFRRLVVAGSPGVSVGKIGEELSLPAATLSFHLKELSHAGLIQRTQEGKFVYYSAQFKQMNELLAFLVQHCCDESDAACGLELPQCVDDAVKRRKPATRKRALLA